MNPHLRRMLPPTCVYLMLGVVFIIMMTLVFKKDTKVGFHFDYKSGETMYFEEGGYSDSFMEWTYRIYKPNEKGMAYCGSIRSSCLRKAQEDNT